MLAVARERHPAHSVGHIRLLSSPFRPGGGGEGLGERGERTRLENFCNLTPQGLEMGFESPARHRRGRVMPLANLPYKTSVVISFVFLTFDSQSML